MKKSLNPITSFVEEFRREPLSSVVFYVVSVTLIIGLFEFGSALSQFPLILAITFGAFSAKYVSFSMQRRDIDQSHLRQRKRVSYLVSAGAFLLIYLRIGFSENLAGPIWAYGLVSTLLLLLGAPAVAGDSGSEQGVDRKPDHVPS